MRLPHLISTNSCLVEGSKQRICFRLLRQTLPFLFVFLFLAPHLVAQQTSAISKQAEPPENILILELFFKNIYLDDAFIAYQKGDRILVSLGPLFSRLEFPITVDSHLGKASGQYVTGSPKFEIDLANNTVEFQGQISELRTDDVFWTDEEILVSTQLLEKWFPLKFQFNSYDQSLTMQSRILLPLEERIEREKRKKELIERKTSDATSDETYIKSEYSLFSIPNTDIRFNYTWSNQEDSNSTTISTLSRGDLLYSTLNLSTSITGDNGLRTLRVSLGRRDQDISVLGLVDITEYEVGDIFTPARDLINRANYGSGFSIENFPFLSGGNVGTIPLSGILEAGWEVELYSGDLLIDFTSTQDDGSWEFQNVPLSQGLNIFVVKFYGPTGEKSEITFRYYYNPELAQKHHLFYRLAINRHRENLYSSDYEKDILEKDPAKGKTHTIFDLEYGLFEGFTLKGGYIEIPLPDDGTMASYNRLGLKTSVFGIYTSLDHVEHAESKGTADQLSFITRFGKYNLLGKYQTYNGEYESEERPYTGNPINTAYEIRLSSIFSIPDTFRFVYSLTKQTKFYLIGGFNDSLILNLTFPYGNSSFSSRYNQNVYQNESNDTVTNSYNIFSLRQIVNADLSIRSDLRYDIEPISQPDYFTVKPSFQINDKSSIDGRFTYYFEKEEAAGTKRESFNSYAVQYIHKFKSLLLGLVYTQQQETTEVSLNITSSFGQDNIQGDWIMTPIPLSEKGFITVRVYFDENQNGVFDEGDLPLENVRVKLNRKYIPSSTNAEGLLTMEDVLAYKVHEVELDEGSLENLYWMAKNKVKRIKLHPGTTLYLDFIVEKTGEIEGTIYEIVKNEKKEAGGVELELYDSQGILVKKTKSLFDGFFLFDRIPKGEYQVKVSENQLQQYGYKVIDGPSTMIDLREEDLQVLEMEIEKE